MIDYLEQLLSEWYEYQGYFVHRNLWVGLEPDGSYECELDVVAYHPTKNHLVHIEPTMNCLNWEDREKHFRLKFAAGRRYLPKLFAIRQPQDLEQIALLVFADKPHPLVGGGRCMLLSQLLAEILSKLTPMGIASGMLPEQWPLLRTLQLVAEYRNSLCAVLLKGDKPG